MTGQSVLFMNTHVDIHRGQKPIFLALQKFVREQRPTHLIQAVKRHE